ncbi:hypothetical protein BDV3_006687 [Batrachochytrium dendrobatidis]
MTSFKPPTFFSGNVLKPDEDNRDYQIITLANGLQAVVISDPSTDKAAAAMDVHVGHLCDPEGVAGLAHFCEHLLFMGTEKYPQENDYSQFLSEHGGQSNAFTSAENTNYHFEVSASNLEGALDRFAQFFICPLFSESGTDRELNAVDSEHKKNIQVDTWRNYQLQKDLCNPKHPFVKFGTGNLETLKDIPLSKGMNLRKVLLEFHDKYYSANIMKLAVVGKEPIETLVEWVASKFSDVKNKSIDVPIFSNDALTAAELQKEILVKPVKETRTLTLTFPCADTRKLYKCSPSQYASHLIGHESNGSILSLLKKKGWAHGLTAGNSGMGARGFEFMRIIVELTETGLENYEDIIEIIFQYIALIKSTPIEEWIFHEAQAVTSIAFRFKEKSSPFAYASTLAKNLQLYEPQDVISGSYLLEYLDRDAIKADLSFLKPDSFRTMIVSPNFDTTGWTEANYYGTKYSVKDFTESLKKRLLNIKLNSELSLPEKNTFIPEDFTVEKKIVENPSTHPMIIMDSPILRIWHKQDDTFFVPKANIFFGITTPLAYQDAKSCVLTRLFTDLFKDELNEFSYYAEVAGLQYLFDNTAGGMTLSIHGYNDKMHILLDKIAGKLKEFVVDEQHFDRIKDQLAKSYRNFDSESPHTHAIYRITQITQQFMFSNEQKLAALEPLTSGDVQAFYPSLFQKIHIQQLAHGNITKQHAIDIGKILVDRLAPTELPESQRFWSMPTYKIPEGKLFIHTRNVPNAENLNSAIEYILQIGSITDQKVRIMLGLISQIGQEPAFDQLRTKEQLGYLVGTGMRKQTGMMSYRVVVQSERDPAYLEHRIEAFLAKFESILTDMQPEDFKKHRTAFTTKMLEKLKNIGQESSRYWSHINSLYYDFEQNLHDAEQIQHATQEQVIEFFKRYISPNSTLRHKLSIHMRSQKNGQETGPEGEAILKGSIVLDESTNLDAFKTGLELTDYAKPIKPVETWLSE